MARSGKEILEELFGRHGKLDKKLTLVLKGQATIMAQLDDLKVALTVVDGKVDQLIVQGKPTDLTEVLAQVQGIDAKISGALPTA